MSELRTEARALLETLEAKVVALREQVPADPASSDGADRAVPTCGSCGAQVPAAQTCSGCPWCSTAALLRGERPELATRLLDGALTAIALVRSLLVENQDGAGQHQDDLRPPVPPEHGRPPATRISIS